MVTIRIRMRARVTMRKRVRVRVRVTVKIRVTDRVRARVRVKDKVRVRVRVKDKAEGKGVPYAQGRYPMASLTHTEYRSLGDDLWDACMQM